MKNILKKCYLKSPDELLESFKVWFSDNKKLALIIALVIGFITHVVLLSVIIMSPDGLWNALHYSAGEVETTSGRWAINMIDSLRKDMAIPTITTTISIIVTAITAVFVVDFFDLKSKFSVAMTSGFLAVSPCFAMTLLYAYTADAYAYAFLFSVLAAWCIYREKYRIVNYILAAIFTMLTLALYQCYLGAIIVLCIMKPIIDILRNKKDYKELFIKIGISILVVAVGILLYWVSEKIALNIYGTSLSSYGGANDISIVNTIKNLKGTIKKVYKDYLNFFFGDDVIYNTNMSRPTFYRILYIVMAFVLGIILIFRKAETKKKKIIDACLVVIATLGIPCGVNIIAIIAPSTIFYSLNSAQIILVIPFFMAILEEYTFKRGIILKYIALAMCLIIGITYYLADNVSYFGVRLKYNQAYAMTLRMVDRIETAEGYDQYKPWAIVGIVDTGNTIPVTDLYFLTYGGYVNGPIFHGNYWGSIETWKKFIQIFMGIQPTFASPEDYYRVCGTEEFKDMPIFPNPGSVKEIDGIMVVKYTHDVPQ